MHPVIGMGKVYDHQRITAYHFHPPGDPSEILYYFTNFTDRTLGKHLYRTDRCHEIEEIKESNHWGVKSRLSL